MLLVMDLMMAVQTGVRWNLSVVLICIYFMARDGEHFICSKIHLETQETANNQGNTQQKEQCWRYHNN
jgi:hypothetical protein